jgi:hypothetical protein
LLLFELVFSKSLKKTKPKSLPNPLFFYCTSNSFSFCLCFQPIRLSSFARPRSNLKLSNWLAQLTLSLFRIDDGWTPPVIPPLLIWPEQDSCLSTCSAPVYVSCDAASARLPRAYARSCPSLSALCT